MNKMETKKTALMPSGIDSFATLVRHRNPQAQPYLFVDKTLFIRDFMNAGDNITLITRPRRFGKTLTLSMLEHFLASEVNGQPTKGLFDGLKISAYPKIMQNQGQYPVIFLTLKEIKGRNFEEFFERFQEVIKELFQVHRYLLDTNISAEDQSIFKKVLNKEATRTDYEAALNNLSRLLYQHTGKKVYILLDEYDTPVHDAYVNGYYEDLRSFLAAMFGKTFKGNNFLARALITGILKVAKSSLFSELNNLKVYTILDDARYCQYFGFTEAETDDLLDRAGLPQKAHELKEMYNGYALEGHTLYNPFSIVSFISELLLIGEKRMEEALKPYWVNTGGTHLITDIIRHNVPSLTSGLEALVQGKAIDTLIDENVIFDPQLRDNNVAFWSILLLAGYLKVVGKTKEGSFYRYKVSLPNEEIRSMMERIVLSVVAGSDHKIFTYLEGIRSLAKGDIEAFSSFLKNYIAHTPSYFDTGGRGKEAFYHGLVLGMASVLSYTHHVTSNRESGHGRYDIALEPKIKGVKAIILELKVAHENEDLQKVAQKAFDQIQSRQYKADMEARGVTDFMLLGMAFRSKSVEIVTNQPLP